MTRRDDHPTPRQRSESDHSRLRDRILEAAEELLREEGPQKLSVRGIARRISYSPASLYHYFPDKDAIVAAILARGGERIGEAIAAAARTAPDPLTALRRAFGAYVETSLARPELARLVYLTNRPGATNLSEGASAANPNLARLAAIVSDGRNAGQIATRDVDLTVRLLWTAAQGLVIRLVLDRIEPGPQRQRLVDDYLDLLVNGLRRRQP
jgi:AcrR family transcriptional regulator